MRSKVNNDAVAIQRRYYSETAQRYDAMHAHEAGDDAWNLTLISAILGAIGVQSILDVGTGTGRGLFRLHDRLPYVSVCGVEPIAALINQALAKNGKSQAAFVQASGDALPFGDASFDAVCSFGILHHVPGPKLVVGEMLRVARKAVIILDSNRFGQGSLLARLAKLGLYKSGLWKMANYAKTRGKGYLFTEGDGVAYSYSAYDSFGQVAAWADRLMVIPAEPGKVRSWLHPLLTTGGVLVCAMKEGGHVNVTAHKTRVAVVSPFLDKSHGTERIVIEWITRLSSEFEFYIYSQEIEDLDLSKVVWRRIPKLRGPHLFNYLWWFAANRLARAWDRRIRGLNFDVVYSPGINCLDADVISVHIVFREFIRRVRSELRLRGNPVRFWPKLLHRWLYYHLIIFLESRVYTNAKNILILIAKKTAADLDRLYHRRDGCVVLYLGFDHATYDPARRAALRETSRTTLGIRHGRFQLLMVGNDWHKKGIRVLLETLSLLRDLPIDLMLVGSEDPSPFRAMSAAKGVPDRARFLPPRKDIEFYYAAADIYVGPSLEDTFALPPVEAMSCGIPVIVSRENGAYEIMTDGADGLILDDPTDAATLASMIRRLYEDRDLREHMGAKAAETARQFSWEQNAHDLAAIFEEIIRRKSRLQAQTRTQES